MADIETQKTKVTLYWLEKSRAQRIVWLLEECVKSGEVEYDFEVFKRVEKLAPPELKKIHPLGKSPVVRVQAPDMEPKIIAESGTLVEYLAEYFAPHLIPKRYEEGKEGKIGGETESWMRYRFFMHYAEGSLMTLFLIAVFIDQIGNSPVPFFIKPVTRGISSKVYDLYLTNNFKTHFSFLESQLQTSPNDGEYLCGKDLTAADIMLSFPLSAALKGGRIDAEMYPKLAAYIRKLEENEVHVESIKKAEGVTGEKYELL